MNPKKDNQNETIITEIAGWVFFSLAFFTCLPSWFSDFKNAKKPGDIESGIALPEQRSDFLLVK